MENTFRKETSRGVIGFIISSSPFLYRVLIISIGAPESWTNPNYIVRFFVELIILITPSALLSIGIETNHKPLKITSVTLISLFLILEILITLSWYHLIFTMPFPYLG